MPLTNTAPLVPRQRLLVRITEFWRALMNAGKQNEEVMAIANEIDMKRRAAIEAIVQGDTNAALRLLDEQGMGKDVHCLVAAESKGVRLIFRLRNLLRNMERRLLGRKEK